MILTSFPEDLSGLFQRAFERKYPGTQVEVLTKPTAAGVRYLQETAGNNTTDLFWVSAPDAFAMLKAPGRLEALQPQASGILAILGGNPLQDPDGTFFGFAVSGASCTTAATLRPSGYPRPRSGMISRPRPISVTSPLRPPLAPAPPTSR